MMEGGRIAMGRRSRFSPAQKRDAVLAVMGKHSTISEVCRELGITEQTFHRWRKLAIEGMEEALSDRAVGGSREAELQARLAETEPKLGEITVEYELRGKALRRLRQSSERLSAAGF
jgi:transposase-like protein